MGEKLDPLWVEITMEIKIALYGLMIRGADGYS